MASIPTPSAIIPTSGALYHRLPPPLTGGAREGQMAWRRWSGIEGPHVQPPPHYAAYPMAACQVSYARPSGDGVGNEALTYAVQEGTVQGVGCRV